MDKQSIFTTSYRGLKTQGRLSTNNNNTVPKYRNLNGCKCAIGHIITDDPTMEGNELDNGKENL